MDFIAENYLWIMIFIIVILMAVVGYIADKTEFIKKSEKTITPKKSKNKKDENKEQPIIIENAGIDELLQKTTKKSSQEVFPSTEDITSPLVNEPINNDNNIDESLFAPLEPMTNEATDELKPVEITSLEDTSSNEIDKVTNEEEDIWKF
jgi:hypothetical protein